MKNRDAKMNIKNAKVATGLTLIETLVAITILLIAIVAPMAVYTDNIRYTRYAGDQVVAFYLAQEAIEYIKFRTATNINNGVLWLTDVPNCGGSDACDCTGANFCEVDVTQLTSVAGVDVCGGSCIPLNLEPTSGLYGYQSGNQTAFTRKVNIEKNIGGNGEEIKVTVVVSWSKGNLSRDVTVEENIFKWR